MRKALLVLLILLGGGLVAADRLGVLVVQDQIGKQVAAEYDLPRQPDVKIHGFPFLTQAVGGEYQRIDVALGDYTQQDVTLRDVRIEMRRVRAPLSELLNGDTSGVVAGIATASGIAPYDLIKRYAPKEITGIAPAGPDLRVDLAGSLGGLRLNGTAVVSLQATASGVQITPKSIGTGGLQVPISAVRRQLSWTVPVRDLPVGSRITRVEVTPGGVRVAATAENVNLSRIQAPTG